MNTTPAPPPALPSGIDERTVFRSLFDAYPDSLLLVDQNGVIALANPSAAKMLGYTVQELTGLNVEALVPDSIRPRHAAYREAYGHTPRARPMGTQMDLVAKRKDGSEVMVEIALSPLQSHGLPFVVAAIRGIEAYPRVKQALQRARYSEHLAQLGRLAVDARDTQTLLDQVPFIAATALQVEVAMVYLLDNEQMEFRVAGAAGPVAGEAVGSRHPNRPDTPIGFAFSQGQPITVADYRSETRFSAPRSYLDAGLVSGLSVPLTDRGRIIGLLAARSCTAQRFGDDEVRFLGALASLLATCLQRAQSEEALNHAQRLESVGQLTGGIAHDFNNLLTIIQGNLQVLEELPAVAENEYAQQLVGAAARASRRGAELTGKLLAFSRRQVLSPRRIEVPAMLHSLADMLRRTLDQRIRIEVDAAQSCPPCMADPGQLESALLNIAINARDAMPEGGSLSFACYPCGTLPPEARVNPELPTAGEDAYVAIAIADTGTGMSDAVKEHAFEPFFTTKEPGRGTGLGLSTVYGFVKQSQGAIALDSEPGTGTTVTLYIPRHVEEQAEPAGQGTAGGDVAAGLNVLMVEDDPGVSKVVQTFLQKMGCTVTACSSGERAMMHLTPDAGFDLLLSDIALGAGMRGTELARVARERLPKLCVLLMSGFSSELIDADRDMPAEWELLRKPFTREELARSIAKLLPASKRSAS